MTILTTIPNGASYKDIRDTLNALILDVTGLKGGTATPTPTMSVTPIAPTAVTSAQLEEYFLFDSASVSSNPDTYVAPTVGSQIKKVTGQPGSAPFMFGSPTSPTWGVDAYSGRPCAVFNGANNFFYRSTGQALRTVVAVYAAAKDGKGRASYQALAGAPSTTAGKRASQLLIAKDNSIVGHDVVALLQGRSDGSTATCALDAVIGAVDVIAFRNDGTAFTGNRSGVEAIAPTAKATATGTALPIGTGDRTLGASDSANDTGTDNFKGNLLAWVSFAGRVSDAEMPGLMQWATNYAKKKWSGKYLFVGFASDGASEAAAAQTLHIAQSDDLTTGWQHRPSNAETTPQTLTRDYGVVWDGTGLLITKSGGNGFMDVLRCTDGFNATKLATITTSGQSDMTALATPVAATFGRKPDGSIYRDANGLPILYFSCHPNEQANRQISNVYVVMPTDGTYQTWTPAVKVGVAGVGHAIDPFVIIAADGTATMFFANYDLANLDGRITYATAPSPLATFTQTSAGADPWNIGIGWEAPSVINTGGNNWTLMIDKIGQGYHNLYSTNGLLGPYTGRTPVVSPFHFQHGEPCVLPAALPNPALQSTG